MFGCAYINVFCRFYYYPVLQSAKQKRSKKDLQKHFTQLPAFFLGKKVKTESDNKNTGLLPCFVWTYSPLKISLFRYNFSFYHIVSLSVSTKSSYHRKGNRTKKNRYRIGDQKSRLGSVLTPLCKQGSYFHIFPVTNHTKISFGSTTQCLSLSTEPSNHRTAV